MEENSKKFQLEKGNKRNEEEITYCRKLYYGISNGTYSLWTTAGK